MARTYLNFLAYLISELPYKEMRGEKNDFIFYFYIFGGCTQH